MDQARLGQSVLYIAFRFQAEVLLLLLDFLIRLPPAAADGLQKPFGDAIPA